MKRFDLIKLINNRPYKDFNLEKDMHGIVMDLNSNNFDVLFFNPHNKADFIIVKIDAHDVMLENEKLTEEMKNELLSKFDTLKHRAKDKFTVLTIKAYDKVELLVEKEKYSQFGIHKGDKGCVMDDNAVKNYVEVDFSKINENGEFVGDCISVEISDLKIINKKES